MGLQLSCPQPAFDALGSLIYDAMSEAGGLPELGVTHPLLQANPEESSDSRTRLQQHLRQFQGDMGNKAPSYLKELIGRLAPFSDDPHLFSLVGLVVSMVMQMAYASSGGTRRSAGSSSSQQRAWELQELMEEYLKRCRINLSDCERLRQDTLRLESQLSLVLTQLKTCLLGGTCDTRTLRQWASGALLHTQMLVHLAGLEGRTDTVAAKAALDHYREDLIQILKAYRCYLRDSGVRVVKSRGGLGESHDFPNDVEDGGMTGFTVTDRETGVSVHIPLSAIRRHTGTNGPFPVPDADLELITTDQYTQAYIDQLFGNDKGPVAKLKSFFTQAGSSVNTLGSQPRNTNSRGLRTQTEQNDGTHQPHGAGTETTDREDEQRVRGGVANRKERGEEMGFERTDESLKLSIVETEPAESLSIPHQVHDS